MKNKLGLVLILMAVPGLALGVSRLCESKLDRDLRHFVHTQRPDLTPEALKEITARRLVVANPESSDLGPLRADVGRLRLMRTGAFAVVAAVLAFGVALWAAGRLAVRDRRVLLRVFRPGYYAASVLLAATTIVNAALLIASIYYAESYLLGMVHLKIIALIGIGALFGAWMILKALALSRRRASSQVFGRALGEAEHPRIWEHVRGMAGRVGSLAPDNIVVGLDPTFFVTEADVDTLEGRLGGRTLFLSAPLCRVLTARQFDAVLGHEMGHFKGEDTRFSREFYPVYQGLMVSLMGLQGVQGSMALAVLPTLLMFSSFLNAFAAAERKLSRERELAADAVAASVTDPRSIAVGLTRIIAAMPCWTGLDEQTVRTLRSGAPLTNVSAEISARVSAAASVSALEDASQQRMSHPTDTHPPLIARLEAVGLSLESIRDDVLRPDTEDPAAGLIDGVEAVETALTKSYREALAQRFDLGAAPPSPAA